MELSSVRELKATLMARGLPEAGPPARLCGAARALRPGAEPEPALALGVAPKAGGGFALAVRLQYRALEGSPLLKTIMKRARNEVDVRYVGRVMKRTTPWYQQRQRPLRIGCSIGHVKVTAGTLGAFVRPRKGGPLAILSNNHVLANENRAKKGDSILQPGAYDGGQDPADVVATLGRFPRLKRSGVNYVDCAMAELVKGVKANTTTIRGVGSLKGVGPDFLDEGAFVVKEGRTTGKTRGRVSAFELDEVRVDFDTGTLRFDDQIEIESAGSGPFSDGGDSGSLIVDSHGMAVGLLFAGTDQGGKDNLGLTYANPIHTVLDALKVDLTL